MDSKIVFDVIFDDSFYIASASFNKNEEHIVTQGEDFEELKKMIKEAMECHFDKTFDDKIKIHLNVIIEI